jgi:hypothetical protein
MGLVSKQPDDRESMDDIEILGFGPLDGKEPEVAGFDLSTWGAAARSALDERLHLLEAPHAWSEDGTVLATQLDSAPWVQRIIEQVDDERSVEHDSDEEQVAYDLTGWDDANRNAFRVALEDARIAYGLDGDELVVLEADEGRVDALVDAILEPDDGLVTDAEPTEDEAREDLLGDLFVAVDRLANDPGDPEGLAGLAAGAAEVASHTPPYGVERRWWRDLQDRLDAFTRLFDAGLPQDDEDRAVTDAATVVRDILRAVV